MKIIVNPHKLEIAKEPVNEREIDITKCEFEFDDEITNDYVKEAYFTFEGTTYKQIIVNNECSIPYEVLEKKGQVEIGVVAFKTEGAEEIKRYNPSPAYFNTWTGSLKDNAENSEPITPTDKEQIESAIANIQTEQVTQNENISQNTSNIGTLSEGKQDKLISGQNIKTINNESLLGAGNLEVITDLSDYYTKGQTDDLLDGKADRSEIPDVSEFITKDVDNLTNYTKTNDMNTAINTAVGNERTNRESSDVALQNQIDAITASSDVVDVVSTYQDLLNYSTTSLTEDDIIKVMQDESHSNAISYFRWQLSTWVYIGSEGPFYTKGETDTLLNNKANVSDIPDLTNYVKNTDYATSSKGGVVKANNSYGLGLLSNGTLVGGTANYALYNSGSDARIISKGTLENVITGKQLVNQTTLEASQAEQDTTIEGLQAELERYKLLENALPHTQNETESDYVTLENTAKAPMEIETIPQTSQETTTGKNLFNVNTTNENKYIDGTNGNLYDSTSSNSSDFIEIKSNSNYTLSFDYTSLLSSNTRTICFYNFDKQRISHITYDPTYKSFNTVTPENAYYVRFTYDKNCFNVQFEEGSTATSYESFTGGIPAPNPDYPEDIHCTTGENQVKVVGKNLFNSSDLISNKRLDTNGEPTISQDGFVTTNYFIPVKPSTTYYSSQQIQGSRCVCCYDKNKQIITRFIYLSSYTFTTTSDTEYIKVSLYADNINNEQIEEGSTATPYTPYEETTYPISLGDKEMFNISNVSDGFVYDESVDKFYINRKIEKVVLDGSESWSTNQSLGDFIRFHSSVLPSGAKNANVGYSNYFIVRNETYHNGLSFYTSKAVYIWINTQFASDIASFKSWLSTHNTEVVYQLAEPTLEEITDTTLISQLRAIKNALSMQGTTHIISTASGSNLPFLIKARAVQNTSNS